ncbi:MAG TPA: hypothetical protein VHD81_00910 [Mycobacteriales bacterium]|nr:hypothetical protein [Mycobacteriales bacterium]
MTETLTETWARVATSTAASVGASFAGEEVSAGSQVSSLLWDRNAQSWWPDLFDEIRRRVPHREVNPVALAAAVDWLMDLPSGMPKPTVGFGDDRTVSVEWDRGGNVLHAMFSSDDAEIYFAAQNGDEFETVIDAGADKIRAAILTIRRS